ncbi:MAG TPA: hypothetical protein ENK50_02885 [Sedimenticola sp.]|nr:hypothetical protein [Sedimenticola sp.]
MSLWLKRLRYRVLFPALARLPLPLAYGIAAGIGILAYLCQPGVRRILADGLCRVWPHLRARPRLLHGILRRHFIMKSWECLDTFVMARMTPRRAAALVRADGLEHLRRARGGGRGVILVMAHFGRVNLHAMSLALQGERLGMLTMAIGDNPELDPAERDYLLFKSSTLHRFIRGRWVTIGSNLRELHRALRQGETLIILLDAYVPGWDRRAVSAPFLGGELALPSGILRLARKTGTRLVYATALQRNWQVQGRLRALPPEPEPAFQAAVRCLEQDVRQCPWLWWQWHIIPMIWLPGEG